jgi:endonuclease/exonuclease/phosphatase family metal-dependent hydrolase
MRRLAVATYNIHRCIGLDRRADPGRIVAVIREMAPDILALQEVESARAAHQPEYLSTATSYAVLLGPTLQRRDGHYGNALLVRHRILEVRWIDLSIPGREPRCALDMDLDIDGFPLRVITTHLGLSAAERTIQVTRLLEAVRSSFAHPIVLLGDLNEWRPGANTLRRLKRFFGGSRTVRSFPARRPLLALDGIWARPISVLHDLQVHASPLARVASDHLPVRGTLVLDGAPRPAESHSLTQRSRSTQRYPWVFPGTPANWAGWSEEPPPAP